MVNFSTSVSNNALLGGASVFVSVYVGGSIVAASARQTYIPNIGATIMIGTNATVTVNGSQAVEIRWNTTGATATADERTMQLLQIG
jgi:hypothetical protein